MVDGLTVRDVVSTEMEQLEQYGEVAQDFFHALAGDIKQDFNQTLNGLLSEDLPAFQQQLQRTLSASQTTAPFADLISGTLGTAIDSVLPNTVFGGVLGAALGGALRTVIGDVGGGRSVDLGRVVRGASRSGHAEINRDIKQRAKSELSQSQQSAQAWEQLDLGLRNR